MDDGIQAFDTTLHDGRPVHIRGMRPDDEAELLQAFERMSADARYMRFMRAVREPNRAQLRQVLASFPANGIGLVATVLAADGVDIVGSAIAVVTGDGRHCEFAVTVDSRFGGAGLATLVMRTLIDAAARRGFVEMEGYVLAINQPMLRLASRLGFSIQPDPEDGSVRLCRLPLAPSGPQPASSGP